ncbi:MAG: hypothetical protein HOC74_29375 [Gemmatimonadetes bacterium]|jgi:hypothetical protein|nr:hypothetical protein [Gemmatimonadota bacterium]
MSSFLGGFLKSTGPVTKARFVTTDINKDGYITKFTQIFFAKLPRVENVATVNFGTDGRADHPIEGLPFPGSADFLIIAVPQRLPDLEEHPVVYPLSEATMDGGPRRIQLRQDKR